jgi:ATP-dependent DNA helicase PIF1
VVELNEALISSIDVDDPRAELIREARLIIWDEAPMANRAVLACVDEVCRQIMGNDLPFGGKVVVLAGDFKQTCPVVRKGTRAQVIDASIRSSPLWPDVRVHHLITPVRNAEDPEFARFVDVIGEGAGPQVDLRLYITHVDTMEDLIDFVFPAHVLNDPAVCVSRGILAVTNSQIDEYNAIMLGRIHGDERIYFAADSLSEADDIGLDSPQSILDFVATHTPVGLPAHNLLIKTDAVFRLLRNFSPYFGMVKNCRVVITGLGNKHISVRILRTLGGAPRLDDEEFFIPRITFTHVLDQSGHTLIRRQFPLAPSYATTFNSCQGLTLDRIGVDLSRPAFSHGQLYTALSRIRHFPKSCCNLFVTITGTVVCLTCILHESSLPICHAD